MTSLTITARKIEMPLSKPNPFVPANAISTQTYIPGSETDHLPPLKVTTLASLADQWLGMKHKGLPGPIVSESPSSHVVSSLPVHAGNHLTATHLPSLGSSANSSLQNLSGNLECLNLSQASHASQNSHSHSHSSSHPHFHSHSHSHSHPHTHPHGHGHPHSQSQPNSQSSSPMVKNGRSDGSSSGGGGGVGGGGGGTGSGTGSGGKSGGKAVIARPKAFSTTPEIALKLYWNKLSPYEHKEILNYHEIYFLGINAKKRPGRCGPNNNDYDNDQGLYIHMPHDHVAYRYEVLKVIGKGSFGQVVKAFDHKTYEHVALKMVRNQKRFHRQAAEEISILRKLREQDKDNTMNIIHMFDSFDFRNHICITFELLSINLYELIKKNKFQGFSLQLVRKFSHSLLQCLDALYKNKIIHCDMKPENVVLKQQGRSGIKVIDFGSSCYENQRVFTYIQSRFYRAPEVILGARYGMPIDMWSLGCILAELYTGLALFPGEDEADQMACIIEMLGMPPVKLLEGAKRSRQFISSEGYPNYCTVSVLADGTTMLNGRLSRRGKYRGPPGSRELKHNLRDCFDPLFLDFIRRCLEWDPDLRMTPGQALKHAWLRRRLPKAPNEKPTAESLPPVSASNAATGTNSVLTTTTTTTVAESTTVAIPAQSIVTSVATVNGNGSSSLRTSASSKRTTVKTNTLQPSNGSSTAKRMTTDDSYNRFRSLHARHSQAQPQHPVSLEAIGSKMTASGYQQVQQNVQHEGSHSSHGSSGGSSWPQSGRKCDKLCCRRISRGIVPLTADDSL
ncbi:dual specificity tyrosine-phosphorylation-regulated kinase 2-like [Prorops nasuta]|uniref:dual specificity tyrosine-phosphorylation-regulated kinase 2-like n=1 Tax=Prorops nasuta TaxID=863751 RepID=UPI0034CF0AA0